MSVPVHIVVRTEIELREDVMRSLTPQQREVVRKLVEEVYQSGVGDGQHVQRNIDYTERLVPEQSAAQAKAQEGHG
jgi:Spy/CpxP family protein refolding chaperone